MFTMYFTSMDEDFLSLSQIKDWMDVTKKPIKVFIGQNCTKVRYPKKGIIIKLVSIKEEPSIDDKYRVKFQINEIDQHSEKIWELKYMTLFEKTDLLEDFDITIEEELNIEHVEKYIKTKQTMPYIEWLEKMGHMVLGKKNE